MCLRIARLWGREPGWFLPVGRPPQVPRLAAPRLLMETPEQAKKNAQRAKRAELDRRLERFHG